MKTVARLEELAQLLLSIYLFSRLPYAWWVYPLFFVVPDLSLLGNLAGKRAGAISYNLFHHKAVAIGFYLLCGLLGVPILGLVGVLLLGHSSFDPALGFSLIDPNTAGGPSPRAQPPEQVNLA